MDINSDKGIKLANENLSLVIFICDLNLSSIASTYLTVAFRLIKILKLFKSKPLDRTSGNGKENLLTFANNWFSINRNRFNFGKRNFNNRRYSSCYNNRNPGNIDSIFKIQEQKNGFFSEYRRHSKDIGKVISKGFGSGSKLLGICRYVNGNLEREDPHVQSIEDIALAENHLENGYPKIWDIKEQLEQRITELHNEINQIIKQYEEIIDSSIPSKFKPVTNYDPETILTEPVYYKTSFYSCLFEQINKKFNNVPPSRLTYLHDSNHKIKKIIDNSVQVIAQQSFYVEPYFLVDGEKTDLEEFWKIFEGLRSNGQLEGLVKSYNDLKLKLSNIDFNDFYTDIDTLCKNIKESRTILEGSCEYCPKHGFFDQF